MFMTPHLDNHSTTDPKPDSISHDERNLPGITQAQLCTKDDILRQRRLNHSGMGQGWLWVKLPFNRVFPTAAVCVAVRHFLM